MTMTEHSTKQKDLGQQRSRAVRTAWVLAGFALAIFAAFILSAVVGRVPG